MHTLHHGGLLGFCQCISDPNDETIKIGDQNFWVEKWKFLLKTSLGNSADKISA